MMKGASPETAKRVVAYISLGEAENYRWYWKGRWNKAKNRPAWIGPVNPDWDGNFKVEYWDPVWQQIAKWNIDKMIDAGYDGVFFDVVDAYEFWQPTRPSAGTDMANCVSATVGSERLASFTAWLKSHGLKAFLGELGAGSGATCLAALDDILTHLDKNRAQWIGWTYWAAGPWWGNTVYDIEPDGGVDRPQTGVLLRHLE